MEEEDNNKEEQKTAPLLLSLSRFAFPTSRRVVVVFDDTQKALSDMCVRWCFGTSARAGTSLSLSLSLSLSCSFLFSRKSLSLSKVSLFLSLAFTYAFKFFFNAFFASSTDQTTSAFLVRVGSGHLFSHFRASVRI